MNFFNFHVNQQAIATACLDILCVLPFLNPFPLERSIFLQSLLVVLVGGIAWLSLIVSGKVFYKLPRYIIWLIVMYIVWAVVSLLFNHSVINIFGSSFLRLGVLPLFACIGCGLILRSISTIRLLTWLYCSSVLLALVSLFSMRSFNVTDRIGGIFHQADILGVWMGCGLILGLAMWKLFGNSRRWITISQILLMTTLILSQTRVIILLVCVIGLYVLLRSNLSLTRKILSITAAAVFACYILINIGNTRYHLTNTQDATDSIHYRYDLQSDAVDASLHRPLFGYGAGNVTSALSCPSLHSPALQQTCQDGFYFNSSHNIYLDRVLSFGLIGGFSFVLIVVCSLYYGLRSKNDERFFAYGAILIALYYLTNVTNVTLELLLWVLLLRSYTLENNEKD
jgi:O-antigen ligase